MKYTITIKNKKPLAKRIMQQKAVFVGWAVIGYWASMNEFLILKILYNKDVGIE